MVNWKIFIKILSEKAKQYSYSMITTKDGLLIDKKTEELEKYGFFAKVRSLMNFLFFSYF